MTPWATSPRRPSQMSLVASLLFHLVPPRPELPQVHPRLSQSLGASGRFGVCCSLPTSHAAVRTCTKMSPSQQTSTTTPQRV